MMFRYPWTSSIAGLKKWIITCVRIFRAVWEHILCTSAFHSFAYVWISSLFHNIIKDSTSILIITLVCHSNDHLKNDNLPWTHDTLNKLRFVDALPFARKLSRSGSLLVQIKTLAQPALPGAHIRVELLQAPSPRHQPSSWSMLVKQEKFWFGVRGGLRPHFEWRLHVLLILDSP